MICPSFQRLLGRLWTPNRIVTIAVIPVSTLILCAAGFYNRYPLLYPDSIEYIEVGKSIWKYYISGIPGWFGQRSPFYSLFVYLTHQDSSLWFVILGQGIILSYVLWLTFKKICPKLGIPHFLFLIISITLLTSVSWYTSFLMPDIFAAILILGIFNLSFDNITVTTFQHGIIVSIVIMAITFHTSHFMLTPALIICAIIVHLIIRSPLRLWMTVTFRLLATFVVATSLMLTATYSLYGKLGLIGPHPPFLLARVITDGPGKLYLKEHCNQHNYAICKYLAILPKTSDEFLWNEKSVMKQATKEDGQQIRKEELSVVLNTVLKYPWKQLEASAKNFVKQSLKVLPNFSRNPWIDDNIVDAFPVTGNKYFQSRQYLKVLPPTSLKILQFISVIVSPFFCIFIRLKLRRRIPDKLFALIALTLIGLLGNNLIAGVLAVPVGRFSSRIIWLVPMLSILFVYVWADDIQKDDKGGQVKTTVA